jgi:hypothetical protein
MISLHDIKIINVLDSVHTIPAWNSAGRKLSRFQLFTRSRQIIFCFDNMLHKSVKIDRIKYPTTTLAVLLISFDNRNEILTVRRSHGTLTVEFRSVFKLLRLAYRFQTLIRLALRFHIFSYPHRVNATRKRKNFVPFSNSAGIV